MGAFVSKISSPTATLTIIHAADTGDIWIYALEYRVPSADLSEKPCEKLRMLRMRKVFCVANGGGGSALPYALFEVCESAIREKIQKILQIQL